jgi:hypothetical protein
MTQITKAKKFWLALLVAMLILAALPTTALAQEDLVRFRIENRADRGITIRLYAKDGSGRAYYMHVEALTTKSLSAIRGVYDYRLTACGIMLKGTVDLNKPLNWINPNCGDKGGAGTKAPNTQDVGRDILKLVKIKLVNRTGDDMQIWLAGPFPFVFSINAGSSKTVSIPKGSYTFRHYACDGVLDTGNLFANVAKTRVIECD